LDHRKRAGLGKPNEKALEIMTRSNRESPFTRFATAKSDKPCKQAVPQKERRKVVEI